jgi:hypothetical protein
MNNEENYKNLEKVMHEWVNPKTFSSGGLFYSKNTVEHVNFQFLRSINSSVLDKNNIFVAAG